MNEIITKEPGRAVAKSNAVLEPNLTQHEVLWLANFTSKNTRQAYANTFRDFCGYFYIQKADAFRQVDGANIVEYRDRLLASGYSNRTIRNKMAALSSCFKFLISKHVITINPVEGIQRPKVDESVGETPVMSAEQVKAILSQPDTKTVIGARDFAILNLLFYTGARIGALRTIKVKDLYLDNGFYVLKWQKKGGANQILPVAPALQSALLNYLEQAPHADMPTAPLFHAVRVDQNQGRALSNKAFEKVWQKYRGLAGLPEQFTPHSARATFATTADAKGVPIQDIQTALGHANISTTQAYIKSHKHHAESAVFAVRY